MVLTTSSTSLKLRKSCSFFQLGKCLTSLVGLFLFKQSPKRAKLKGNADQWNEPTNSNRMEDYKP